MAVALPNSPKRPERPNRGISITAKRRWVAIDAHRSQASFSVWESQKSNLHCSQAPGNAREGRKLRCIVSKRYGRQNSTSGCLGMPGSGSEEWWEIPSLIGRDSRHTPLSSVRICKRGALWGVRIQDAREVQSGLEKLVQCGRMVIGVDFTFEPQCPPLECTLSIFNGQLPDAPEFSHAARTTPLNACSTPSLPHGRLNVDHQRASS
ncbi:hypothetical protein DFP72DRAFT_860954 [Ephemerocybe angulata]|uniref:Uncharacterized protein n=1 Tax=Ephemerocybe angulata TaxID=980116 RepID=A0A8H6LV03_9AGAR|nr:hypothetical protein DFP72DRAFT_860954 [Tulosesus angulatus]